MQEQHLFEYAVVRIVPRVEREEFINVGIVLFCKKKAYLKMAYQYNPVRLQALFPSLDMGEIELYLQAFEAISEGKRISSPIAALDAPSRFRWLTATRSTVVQTSRVHPGFCADMNIALQKLMEQYVL